MHLNKGVIIPCHFLNNLLFFHLVYLYNFVTGQYIDLYDFSLKLLNNLHTINVKIIAINEI